MPQWAKEVAFWVIAGPPLLFYAAILLGVFALVWVAPFILLYRALL